MFRRILSRIRRNKEAQKSDGEIIPPGEEPAPLALHGGTLEENLEEFWQLLQRYDGLLRTIGRNREVTMDGDYVL